MKKGVMKFFVMGMVLVLGLTSFVGCQKSETATKTESKSVAQEAWTIPVLSAVTGPIAFVGKPASWSAEYAAKVINEQGGINGKLIKVDVYDTKFDTAEAVSCMSKVVDDSWIIVGPMDAPGGEAVGQLTLDAKVPNIAAYSFTDIRKKYAPYAISYMTDSEEGDWLAAKQWIQLNSDIKTVAIFTNPTDVSQMATTKMLQTELATIGVTVEKVIEVETDTLDCGPAAVQAINAGVDGYISVLRADENAKVVSELRTRGVDEGRRITCGFSAFSKNYIDVAGADVLDGTYIWNKLDVNYKGEEWTKLVDAYKVDNDGATPTDTPVPEFYNAIMAIKQCFEELKITGDADKKEAEKEAIAKWLYNSPVIKGVQGEYQWIEGKKVAPIYYFQFKGNVPVAVGQ